MSRIMGLALFVLMVLGACSNSTSTNNTTKTPIVDTACKYASENDSLFCEDPSQDLVAGPLLAIPETPAEVKKWLGSGTKITVETNTDPDDSTELDSTIIVHKSNTSVRFLNVDGEPDFWDADIASNSIPLAPQSAIGITKEQFLALNKLHLKADCDTLLVASEDENYIVTYYFRADTLYRLHIQEPME